MAKYKKPTYIIIQEAMAERIRFLEDELYERAYKDIEKLEAKNDFLKGLCNNQLEIIMDYEWKQMQERLTIIIQDLLIKKSKSTKIYESHTDFFLDSIPDIAHEVA